MAIHNHGYNASSEEDRNQATKIPYADGSQIREYLFWVASR